ncbi:LpxL/LpxP family acyltransferase [Herbaspirillum seropedicae]|uniref:LpxL/LpxP family acyltransferase n=1 Tax=Herbaspirillum seropedicae TaxID=964 RepID=UPI0028578833|nr:acyltransferase [Herbaspirillum seropedicae]MDR6395463.1 putative LPLAT superfamily acyltransferase [Herbaspirillum seropedicae]
MSTSSRTRHWAQINEVSFVAGMRLLFAVYRLLGRLPFRLMLYPVLCWYIAVNGPARRASRRFLEQVRRHRPDLPLRTGIAGVLRHFAAFGESLLDKMLLWGGLFPVERVQLHGSAHITDAIAAGRGGLIICTHLGNLELCRVIGRQHPALKLTVLVHTRHAQAFNQMLAQLDPGSQLNLMQVTEMSPATAIVLAEKVAQGEFVVIAGDRVPVSPQPRVAHASFMGKNAPFPIGPYVMAALLQCPVYLMFSRRSAEGAEVSFEAFRQQIILPRKQRDQVLAELAAAYATRLEAHCLQAPYQWFNFYDFWADSALDEHHASH